MSLELHMRECLPRGFDPAKLPEVSVIVLTMGCVRRGKQQLQESPQLHLCAVVGGPQRSFLGQCSAWPALASDEPPQAILTLSVSENKLTISASHAMAAARACWLQSIALSAATGLSGAAPVNVNTISCCQQMLCSGCDQLVFTLLDAC